MTHRLISRDGYDECVQCGQTFDHGLHGITSFVPCQTGSTEPHVWTRARGGAECAYCAAQIGEQAPAVPSVQCLPDCPGLGNRP